MQSSDKKAGMRLVPGLLSLVALTILFYGCSTKKPDFQQLRADLEKKLEDDRGKMTVGNADIYRIVSLEIVDGSPRQSNGYSIAFKGEVECIRGFYMSTDGRYAFSKPSWKAKRHVTKGTTFEFGGKADYRKSKKGWQVEQITTKMSLQYAPPV